MKRSLLIYILLLLIVSEASGQSLWRTNRIEITAGFGTTQFFGDIGGFSHTENVLGIKDFSLMQTRFNISLATVFRIQQDLNVRLNLAYGMFHASDTRGSNEARGMEATTGFFEHALIGEYYFIKNRSENSFLFSRNRGAGLRTFFETLDMYLFTGVGGLVYNVNPNEALLEMGMKTGGYTAIIPAGVGVKLVFSPELNFGIEMGGRYAFSDYIEGYTSQYSRSNDVYYFLNATVTYKLNTTTNGIPTFLR